MTEVSFAIAFAGGVLAILSPCSALLLPAFFAVAFTSRARLVAQAFLFYLGLATIFIPLGLGISAVAALFTQQRELVILVGGALLVGLGLYTLAGGGFVLAPSLAGRLQRVEGRLAAYATGLTYGFAGFCTGPILGAVLTVAATAGDASVGAALLAAYALGMTLPVFALALAWDRWRIGERGWLRARIVEVRGARVPLTRLLAGSLFVLLGVAFVVFRGSSALAVGYEALGLADLSQTIETRLASLDLDRWIALAAVVIVAVWLVPRGARAPRGRAARLSEGGGRSSARGGRR